MRTPSEPHEYQVRRLSKSSIIKAANDLREVCGISQTASYFCTDLLLDQLEGRYPNFQYFVLEDKHFSNKVESYVHGNAVFLRESIYLFAGSRALLEQSQDFRPNTLRSLAARARFTIAHEIGHWFLHRGQAAALTRNHQDKTRTMPPDAHRLTSSEYQANVFAAHLLVTSNVLDALEEEGRLNQNQLAKKSCVSKLVAKKHIRQYYKDRYGVEPSRAK